MSRKTESQVTRKKCEENVQNEWIQKSEETLLPFTEIKNTGHEVNLEKGKKKKKEKVDESEIKLATFAGIQRKQGNSKKTPASLTSANCVNHSKVENS